MARVLEACTAKAPSLRDTYPALNHIRTPTDLELHFRAWYSGATNLLCLAQCAQRILRLTRRLFDIVDFRDHLPII